MIEIEVTMAVHDWTSVPPGIFHAFHHKWIGTICDALNDGLLPEGFYAMEEQVAGGPHPDVLTLEKVENVQFPRADNGGTAVALAERPPKVRFIVAAEELAYARKANHLAIRHVSGDRVVAFVEIVSPGNKSSATELSKFLEKLHNALDQGCHLLVIDLHPPGRHDPHGLPVAFWDDFDPDTHTVTDEQPFSLAAYRADVVPTAYVELAGVGEKLPEMPLFLTADYYVSVPLDETYVSAWQRFPKRWRRVIEGKDTADSAGNGQRTTDKQPSS